MEIAILLGPPGSGKGTQAKLLSKNLNFSHFSTGESLRKEINSKSELGKQIKKTINSGELVSDELIFEITKKFILENKNNSGIILDGYPRTIKQAELLIDFLRERNIKNIKVVNLKIPNQEVITRLLKRAKIENRTDDNEQTIKNRIKVYNNSTEPLVNFFREKNLLKEINGLGEVDEIQNNIIKELRSQ